MTSADHYARPFSYDVFLSHNQADQPRVRRLAERLNPKAECRMQNAEVLPSSFSIHPFLAVGLERSTVRRGNLPFRDPANAGRRFIPLLLADCKLPPTLRPSKHDNLRRTRDLLLPRPLPGQVELAAATMKE